MNNEFKKGVLGLGFMAASIWTIAAYAADGKDGTKLDDNLSSIVPLCAACHGIDGISSVGMYPHLAGQNAEYLAKQLRDFRSGDRQDAVMRPMAEPLSDAAIDALARHFGAMGGRR
ncbi:MULTISPECIES: cytochrome c [unclassified Cupriavidus]|uniref:c-type cytochrome n=1 Tax=unclassified Cupriavidus TaxID=2640874 RepID=UPI001F2D23B1|nr:MULTISPECIES: cytochrome c [unclassified Cupriavidus]